MQRLEIEHMKRTLTITMAVALIGSLMFMGFAGTAAAQNNNNVDDVGDGISVDVDADFAPQDQTAETNINIDQQTQNEQIGEATAETNVLAANLGGAGGTAAAAPADKKGAAPTAAPAAADGGATALGVSEASVDQVQDHDQSNTAEVSDVTTETGDNIQDASVDVTVDNNNNNND